MTKKVYNKLIKFLDENNIEYDFNLEIKEMYVNLEITD